MCTWAGYVGRERAAPVLLEMARRQEGLWSGFYSGLVTLAEGTLHWDKVVGAMAKLEGETAVADFPGTIGLIHSRTNSGGGREWGHPFVSADKAVAVVAQGSSGLFKDDKPRIELGNELLSIGRRCRSAVPGQIGKYPMLRDGCSVHTSEIVAQAVAVEYERSKEPCHAIRRVINRMPSEAIFAFLFRDEPERVFVGNVNQRVVIGRDEAGTCFASSALALPDCVRWRTETPANTLAVIESHALTFESLAPTEQLPVDEMVPPNLDTAFLEVLRANPRSSLAQVLGKALWPLFPAGRLVHRAVAGYQTMERLLAAGVIRAETETVPGVNGEGTAPRAVFFGVEGK